MVESDFSGLPRYFVAGGSIRVHVKSMWPSAYSLQLYEFDEHHLEVID